MSQGQKRFLEGLEMELGFNYNDNVEESKRIPEELVALLASMLYLPSFQGFVEIAVNG